MAAVIVKGGSLLSIGYNHIEDHPAAYYGCSFHAEYDAIRKSRASIAGAKMFVYRFGRADNLLKESKPCLMCQQKIASANISSVTFINGDNTIQRESFKFKDIPSWYNMHHYINNADCYIID